MNLYVYRGRAERRGSFVKALNIDTTSAEFQQTATTALVELKSKDLHYDLRLQSGPMYLLTQFLRENGHEVYCDFWFTSIV